MTDETTTAARLRALAYQSPFSPFKVALSNGETFEVSRRFRTMVWHDRAFFGIEITPENGVDSRMKVVLLKDIASVVPKDAAA